MKSLLSFTDKNLGIVSGVFFCCFTFLIWNVFKFGGIDLASFGLILSSLLVGGLLLGDFKQILLPATVASLVGIKYIDNLALPFASIFILTFIIFNSYRLRPKINLETIFAQITIVFGLIYMQLFKMGFSLDTLKIAVYVSVILGTLLVLFGYAMKDKKKGQHVSKDISMVAGFCSVIYTFVASHVLFFANFDGFKSFEAGNNMIENLGVFIDMLFLNYYLILGIHSFIILVLIYACLKFNINFDKYAKDYFGKINGSGTTTFKMLLFGGSAIGILLMDFLIFNFETNRLIVLFTFMCFGLNYFGERLDQKFSQN